jgi:hypothetical protein
MIAPVYPQQTDASYDLRPITIHLHIPREMTAAFMQLVTAITAQRSLFQEDFVSRSVSDRESEPRLSPASRKGHGERLVRPAATPEAEASTSAEVEALPTGPQAASPEPATESLLDLYRRVLKSKRSRKAGKNTIGDHESSMRAWDLFAAQQCYRCIEPVALLEHPDILRAFSEFLIRQEELAPCTVNRRLTHLMMVAKEQKLSIEKPAPEEVKRLFIDHKKATSGSDSPSTRKGRVKAKSAIVRSDSEPLESRRIPSFEEIDTLARSVACLTQPYGEHSPYFWRGWIRFLAFIGCRSRDVVSTLPSKTGLTRSDVVFDTLCPVPDVNNALGRELHSPHGWMHYVIGKDHHSDNRRILFPMPKWMRDWARFFIEFSSHPQRVFPSSAKHRKSLAQKTITMAWNQLLKATQLDPRLIPSEGSGDKIAIRKFAANWWHITTMQQKQDYALAEKMSHYVLHHAEVTTSNKHYLSVQAACLPVMLELMPLWPIPAADAPPVSMLPE